MTVSPLEMLTLATRSATRAARENDGTVGRVKSNTAENVLQMIEDGTIPLRDSELLAVTERMNRASGTADRSVAVSMLEVIIGVGIRRAA